MKIANVKKLPGATLALIALTFVGNASTKTVGAESRSDYRPNIILIMADDLGFNQLGCYGDTPIKTPHLDRLAGRGIRFTQAYAGNTVCSPSRVSLFTGRDGRLMENNSNTVQLKEITGVVADKPRRITVVFENLFRIRVRRRGDNREYQMPQDE